MLFSCSNYGQLKLKANLPKKLKEASGIVCGVGNDVLWMHNDGGNKNVLYQVNGKGKIQKTLKVKAKNTDWEDIASDDDGNLYIGDFGNNANSRDDLVILKLKKEDLVDKKNIEVTKIKFYYPNQNKFPPKKKKRFFDAESLLYFNNYLYIFTKSRVKKEYGKTSLYKIPAKAGRHEAIYISSFNNCNKANCWITAASISKDKKKVALLTHNTVLLFTDFKSDNFLNGTLKKYNLEHTSQKEGLDFKDNNTLYLTDERAHGKGGKLYELKLE